MPETAYGLIVQNEEAYQHVVKLVDTEAIVRSYFEDIPIMIEVARCESTFTHKLENGKILRGRVDSDDTGVMQINRYYHEKTAVAMGLELDNIYENMAYARYLYEKQGTQPWSASMPCWGSSVLVMNV